MIEPNNIYHGDCYELIKQIPDKSVDLVYIDIPYQFQSHGGGGAFGPKNRHYNNQIEFYTKKFQEEKNQSDGLTLWKLKQHQQFKDFETGIDYSIFDELVRVMKYIYIYMVQ